MTKLHPGIVAVDLFCGVSGLSYGLQRAGIHVAAGVDIDPACRYPFEENTGATFLQKDVCKLTAGEVRRLFNGNPHTLIAACAPCQPFSGYTTARRSIDERWRLLLECLRIVKAVRPTLVTLENVPRLAKLPLWTEVTQALRDAGYFLAFDIVDASSFGVPQKRQRLVLLASRLGPISLPKPNSGTATTVRAAIGSLPAVSAGGNDSKDRLHAARSLTPRNMKRIKASRPSGTWRDWPLELRVECHNSPTGKTYPSVYGRMSWEAPSPTITTQFYGFGNGRFGHPQQDRAITLREGALLQSFPRDFAFVPPTARINFRQIGRLIGNAVPPLLAQAIGQAIKQHVKSFPS